MKYVYCPITKTVVPKGEELVEVFHQIITDTIDVVSPVDRRHYASKSSLRAMYERRGLVEIHGCGLKHEGQFERQSDALLERSILRAFETGGK